MRTICVKHMRRYARAPPYGHPPYGFVGGAPASRTAPTRGRDSPNVAHASVSMQWNHNAAVASKKKGTFSRKEIGDMEEYADEDDLGPSDDEEGDAPLTEEAQKEKEDEEKRKAEEENERRLTQGVIKKGDWQVIVHIIEAKDLKGEDSSGTSDPVTIVRLLGQKQSTKIRKKCTACTWDDVMFFNFTDMRPEEIETAVITSGGFPDE